MSAYNTFLIALAAVFGATTTMLAAYNVQSLAPYIALYAIEVWLMILVFGHLHPRASGPLNGVGYGLVGALLVMLVLEAAGVLRLAGFLR